MGGDHGCGVVIEGAKRALAGRSAHRGPFLVGDKDQIHAALPTGGFRDHRVRVVHASEVLTMDDKPAAAVRRKKDCSIVRAIELVHEGKADAVVPSATPAASLPPPPSSWAAFREWTAAASPR